MARTNGTVKWFSQEEGYGFLQQPGGPDVFVHHSTIEGNGFKVLYEGEEVEFEVMQADKGLKAQNVVRLNPPAEAPRRGGGQGGGQGRGAGRAGAGRYSDRGYDDY
jgi:CspA family cold shock protein